MEARESFMDVSTRGSRDPLEPTRDPLMMTTFLETCLKFLHNNRVVRGLHEVINRCTGWGEPHAIWKIGRHALRTGWEMRLTA